MSTATTPAVAGQVDPLADLSHLSIRDDGVWLVSLEDADNRDVSGRKVIMFVVMTDEERARALSTIGDATAFAAARTVNRGRGWRRRRMGGRRVSRAKVAAFGRAVERHRDSQGLTRDEVAQRGGFGAL